MSLLDNAELTCANMDERNLDYDINQARDDYLRDMRNKGKVIVVPSATELQIDIDSEEHYAAFQRAIACIERNEVFEFEVTEKPSSSGLPHRHITVHLNFEVEPWQRIALQAALGSDPMRELMSSVRMLKGDIYPTLFVEDREEVKPYTAPPWLEEL